MYYISDNKIELEAYNILVSESEGYDRVRTVRWANVIEHPVRQEFAILVHSKYEDETLTKVESLTADWFPQEDLI